MFSGAPRCEIFVLAFGDSLTAGYTDQGTQFHPWAPVLQSLLGVTAVDHVGFSGWTTKQMREHMDSESERDVAGRYWPGLGHMLEDAMYTCVLILAGTNDLAEDTTPQQIVSNLAVLHSAAHAKGARTVAFTIPESAFAKRDKEYGKRRDEANAAIRAWVESQPRERIMLVESAVLLPFEHGVNWEFDGLHMSKQGYATFGRQLAPRIRDFVLGVRPEVTPPQPPPPSGQPTKAPVKTGRASIEAFERRSGFVSGSKVVVHGLQKAAQHNGKSGTLLTLQGAASEARWGVQLDDGGPPISVREANLRGQTADSSSQTDSAAPSAAED